MLPYLSLHSSLILLVLLVIPVVLAVDARRRRHGIVAPFLRDMQTVFGRGRGAYLLRTFLITVIIGLFVAILARPGIVSSSTDETKRGIDIAITLDISKSMLAEDMKPNRIEAAKQVITEFLAKRDGDRVSLLLFAGKPFVSVPLTLDYPTLIDFTHAISTDSIDQRIP